MYVNLASVTKQHRANQVIIDIGSSGSLNFYTGPIPASPDFAPSGFLLATLPLSSPPATASLAVRSGLVTAGGSGGTDGVYALTLTGGGGTEAAGTFTVIGGALFSIAISVNGYGYTSAPTLSGFSNAGISGAAATVVMTGTVVFSTIGSATGSATGTAGFARVATSGGIGIIDLDVGTTNAYSVVMSNTFINYGGSIICTAQVLLEA